MDLGHRRPALPGRDPDRGLLPRPRTPGRPDQAADELDLPTRAPDLVKPVATEVGYFTGNHHRMQYTDFKANGYYIGSGPVESACNTIVKQRAKRAGMHWSINGLDPVLAIRTLHQSGRDNLLWPTPQN